MGVETWGLRASGCMWGVEHSAVQGFMGNKILSEHSGCGN